ncbi:MAG: tetratricopeptide repeat protein [Propionibacteriales bacterium]|nr:tetratricopeptide repeat protein [Propionibacteriales bacterium]
MADQRGRRDDAPKKGGPRQGGAPRKGAGSDRAPFDRSPQGRGKPSDRSGKPSERAGAGRRASVPANERVDQSTYDGPPLPDDINGMELDASIRVHLKELPDKLGTRVARHLAAAGRLIDDEPEVAYQHALAAKARAPRLAVVREAVGEAAYAAGLYAEALSELRAAKRMNGATAYLPIMADCHRALGNPTRALELAKSPSVARFAAPAKAEMTIVEAGARRDLGQFDAALRTLEVSPLNHKGREAWVVRLRYAYADTLEQAGRLNDALTWFHKTNAIDADEDTDAADRAESLEKRVDRN